MSDDAKQSRISLNEFALPAHRAPGWTYCPFRMILPVSGSDGRVMQGCACSLSWQETAEVWPRLYQQWAVPGRFKAGSAEATNAPGGNG